MSKIPSNIRAFNICPLNSTSLCTVFLATAYIEITTLISIDCLSLKIVLHLERGTVLKQFKYNQ